MLIRACSAVAACSLLLLADAASSHTAAPVKQAPPRVTLIADSVAAAISLDTGAKAILGRGIDLFLEPGPARRLGGTNPPDAIAPPTAVALIDSLGRRLGPTVIVCVGYNDVSSRYAENMEAALDALRGANVRRVLWVTLPLNDAHRGYLTINDAIEAAATAHPEVTVVDWNRYASGHPEWFQSDGVHLSGDGPRALARLMRASLAKLDSRL